MFSSKRIHARSGLLDCSVRWGTAHEQHGSSSNADVSGVSVSSGASHLDSIRMSKRHTPPLMRPSLYLQRWEIRRDVRGGYGTLVETGCPSRKERGGGNATTGADTLF